MDIRIDAGANVDAHAYVFCLNVELAILIGCHMAIAKFELAVSCACCIGMMWMSRSTARSSAMRMHARDAFELCM